MFAPNAPALSAAGAHDYDPAQEPGSIPGFRPLDSERTAPKHEPEEEAAAKVEGIARTSRGTHTTTPEKRGSLHTPVKGRSLDEPPRQFGGENGKENVDSETSRCRSPEAWTGELAEGGATDGARDMRQANVLTQEGMAATKLANVQPGGAAPKTKEYVAPSASTKIHGRADILLGKLTSDADLKLKGQYMLRGEATKASEVGKKK